MPECVRAEVWFCSSKGSVFYLYSAPDAGKVKRIRNNPKVRVAPCDIRGNLRGAWVDARASPCDPAESERAQQLLRQKYFLKRVGDWFNKLMGRKNVLIAIHFD